MAKLYALANEFWRRPTTKKTTREQTTAYGTPQQGPQTSLPSAQVGAPVPYLIGRQRITSPNVIEYSNLRALTETEYTTETTTETVREKNGAYQYVNKTITSTTTTATTKTVGYLVDTTFSLALGPDVRLRGIFIDNIAQWTGDVGDNYTGAIPAGEDFISGSDFLFRSGTFIQSPYVGVSTIRFNKLRADRTNSSVQFEIQRIVNPLALANNVNTNGADVNIATALYDVITNAWGGIGVSPLLIDEASFRAAAIRLASEGNFCSFLITDEQKGTDIIKALQNQARGLIFQNPITGLIQFRLIRSDVIASSSGRKSFGESNLLQTRNFSKQGWQNTYDQMRVLYTDRNQDYTAVPVFVQNPANLNSSGRGRRTGTVDYPMAMNATLATKLGARDLALAGSPLYGMEAVTTRYGADLLPGDVVFITRKQYGLYGEPMMVEKIRKQPINNNTVVLQLVQYRTPSSDDIFVAPQDPPPSVLPPKPQTPLACKVISAPYFLAKKIFPYLTTLVQNPPVGALFLPTPADAFQDVFSTTVTNKPIYIGVPGAKVAVRTSLRSKFPDVGKLATGIEIEDGFTTGLIPSLVVSGFLRTNTIETYRTNSPGPDRIRDGVLFMLINDEIFSFENATRTAEGQYTLTNVRRSLLDTVPQKHIANDEVFIIDGGGSQVANEPFQAPSPYTPTWWVDSHTITEYSTGDARLILGDLITPGPWNPAFNRSKLPYRPHGATIDGIRNRIFSVEKYAGDTATIAWRIRSRTNLRVPLYGDASDAGEVNDDGSSQIHRVMIRDSAGTLFNCGETNDDQDYTSLVVTIPANAAIGQAFLWVEAETEKGISYYRDEITLTILPSPAIQTEDGDSFLINEAETRYLTLE